MYIKQWLEESLQVLTCQMIINETIWELGLKPKEPRLYEVVNFYKQLLNYPFTKDLEMQLESTRQAAITRGISVQNTLNADGKIVIGTNHPVAAQIFGIQQKLIREHYATV